VAAAEATALLQVLSRVSRATSGPHALLSTLRRLRLSHFFVGGRMSAAIPLTWGEVHAAPAAVAPWDRKRVGDLLPFPEVSGALVNLDRGLLLRAFSYNPRRDAFSRRRWGRENLRRFAALPRQASMTLTLPAKWHGCRATWEMLAYESQAVRLFKQSVDRVIRRMFSEVGLCTVCVHEGQACEGEHQGRRWRPEGRCAQCAKWKRLEWWCSRAVFACSGCLASPRLRPLPRDRREPSSVFSWIREMADFEGNLDNPHRHILALMPYIPQGLLSVLAERAGLGEVLDIQVDREQTARSGLDAYLTKQSRLFVPSHPSLSAYFTKQAAQVDAFNALPVGAARLRVNYPIARPEKQPGWVFLRGVGLDEARRRFLPWTLPRDDPDWFPAPEPLPPRQEEPPRAPPPEHLQLPLPRLPSHNPLPL